MSTTATLVPFFTDQLAIGVLPLLTLVVAVAVLVGLQLVISRTGLGRALRAASEARTGPVQPRRTRAERGRRRDFARTVSGSESAPTGSWPGVRRGATSGRWTG
jgi:hypothetical protein